MLILAISGHDNQMAASDRSQKVGGKHFIKALSQMKAVANTEEGQTLLNLS